jgi:hypothetical protein
MANYFAASCQITSKVSFLQEVLPDGRATSAPPGDFEGMCTTECLLYMWILKGSDDGVELMRLWTLSIVRYPKKLKNSMFRKLDLFPSSGDGETQTVEGNLYKEDFRDNTPRDLHLTRKMI